MEAAKKVKLMTDVLRHRGPDAEGLHVDDHVALGHRRLSIIDLSQGQQPMASLDGHWQIVFNGEIYNFQELRVQLEAEGRQFQSHSDTEVLLQSYQQWGSDCLLRLNGMFAFAIWNNKSQTLFLARDRVGKKPLYYYFDGKVFFFASELKALLPVAPISREIQPEALDCYFSYGYIPAPLTIFRGVQKLPAAHALTVSAKGLKTRKYWDLEFSTGNNRPENTILEEFSSLFDDAVAIRLMSEVPLGAFLSGGLDSTLTVSSMSKSLAHPVLTNTIGFGSREHNELPVAQVVSQYLKTDHREFVVEPRISDILQKIAWHFDEPFADSSAVPSWYVCEMAKQNVTVALSGDGGDENFGGYTFRYLPHVFESKLRHLLPLALRRVIFGGAGSLYPASARLPKPLRLKTILENMGCTDSEAFYHDLIWLRSESRQKLYSSRFKSTLTGFSPVDVVAPFYNSAHASDPLNRALYADIHFYMTDNCLVKVDRMSMAHSLEVRSPFLDYRLMEFAAGLPTNLKIKGNKGKIILRNLARQRLPSQVLNQPKKGFSVPAAQWLRGDLCQLAEEAIFNKDSFCASFLEKKELTRLWKEHQAGSRDHHVFLWGVMMLELWAGHYLFSN